MRLRLGRPDINAYLDRFDVPPADDGLAVTFLGVSSLLIDDGSSAILTDGYFSRPSLARVGLGKIAPDPTRIASALDRAGIAVLDAVIPVHTHFDHALDSADVAIRTGAPLVGGPSAAQVGRGSALPEARIIVVTPSEPLTLGGYELTFVTSHHCPPDRFPGEITEPVTTPTRAAAFRCGDAWSILLRHNATGRSALIQGSAGYVRGALAGRSADVAYLGVGQLGLQSPDYIETYWNETVRAVSARRAVLIHWDDFFRPLDEPLRALPYAGDDLDATMSVLTRLAKRDGVTLNFPTVFARENPWA
ncbi:MBL fold metallo-hydrolase [Aldersonia kunmingensis]|uniref:MBL fold metallo-hydrolase n=1 Tax=Aldersonia kunmingensis TaxID=408066 RepID=UPI0008323132|nr:MBL fold metallo-hydrolase [Aldersonia kunmingensis]